MDLERFDQVWVISDLHLGGLTGHQIFQQGNLLAAVELTPLGDLA